MSLPSFTIEEFGSRTVIYELLFLVIDGEAYGGVHGPRVLPATHWPEKIELV